LEAIPNLLNANLNYRIYKGFWATLDWLLPPTYGGCGSLGVRWCRECQNKVQMIVDPVCNACGFPLARIGLCDRCKRYRPSYKLLRSWAVFEGPAQGALHQLKYRRKVGLGEALATHMAAFIAQLDWTLDAIVVPIPLGKSR
jgi:predicted amidophosphoribosyltransferase